MQGDYYRLVLGFLTITVKSLPGLGLRKGDMELEEQLINLDIAKKLRELGVEQKSLWYWCENPEYGKSLTYCQDVSLIGIDRGAICQYGTIVSCYSAYTVAELGEMLPGNINFGKVHAESRKVIVCGWFDGLHHVQYRPDGHKVVEKHEANARGRMLIYLIENKLIEIKKG